MRCFKLLAIAGLLSAASAFVSPSPESRADLPALDRWLRHESDSAGFSGVVMIERGGRVIFSHAYTPGGRRLTTESAFWLASTTKQFTAAAILKLVDQGKLAVSDSL